MEILTRGFCSINIIHMAQIEDKRELIVSSMQRASGVLKESYGFQFVKKMNIPFFSKHVTNWKPDHEEHTYLEAVKDGKLYKIKVLCQQSHNKALTSPIKELDYLLCFYWRSKEDYSTELMLQV